MACCPACGHTTINTQKSSLVQLIRKWIFPGDKSELAPVAQPLKVHIRMEDVELDRAAVLEESDDPDRKTLDHIPPGQMIQIERFGNGLSLQHQLRLQAFGVEPGQSLSVIQQYPVTIVKVDHTELAVERFLAHQIFVN